MANNFIFGRGFKYKWKLVDVEWTIPIGVSFIDGNDRQLHSRNRDLIVLTRGDLLRGRMDKPKELIDCYDFTEHSFTTREFINASIVIFLDDDGTMEIIKNRYGSTN
jgi:hypothetical protein